MNNSRRIITERLGFQSILNIHRAFIIRIMVAIMFTCHTVTAETGTRAQESCIDHERVFSTSRPRSPHRLTISSRNLLSFKCSSMPRSQYKYPGRARRYAGHVPTLQVYNTNPQLLQEVSTGSKCKMLCHVCKLIIPIPPAVVCLIPILYSVLRPRPLTSPFRHVTTHPLHTHTDRSNSRRKN